MGARQIAIAIAIAVTFPLLVYYGAGTIYPPPKDFYETNRQDPLPPNATPEERKAFADRARANREVYTNHARRFAHVLLMIAVPLGIGAIFMGYYSGHHSIAVGWIFAGLFTIAGGCWGYFAYWYYLEDWLRFLSLLVAFAGIVVVGQRLSQPREAG